MYYHLFLWNISVIVDFIIVLSSCKENFSIVFSGYSVYELLGSPGKYIRHINYRVEVTEDDNSTLFQEDASFQPVAVNI